ncbi:ras-GTPase RSR1, rap subfamily, partial [Diaporthe sp. PMI_573]
RFVHNEWIESYDPTIEDSYGKQIHVDGRQVELEILDTIGTNQSGDGFLLVFSITSRSTLNKLHDLREEILRLKGRDQVPIVLVGNKVDLEDLREVPRTKALAVANEWESQYYEASAKTSVMVSEVFIDLCKQMLVMDYATEAMDEETLETRRKYDEYEGKRERRKRRKGLNASQCKCHIQIMMENRCRHREAVQSTA